MDQKRVVLVVVSALAENDVLYEYGARLAREEGARTLLIDYHESRPLAWRGDARGRATLADLLSGRVSLREVVLPSEVSGRFHIVSGMSGAPEAPLSISPAVFAEGYEAVMVLTPLWIHQAAEWLDRAGAVLLACAPEAADTETVRQCVSRLRERGIVPQLLVDCRGADEAAVHREANETAMRLGLGLWATLEHRGAPDGESATDAGARGRAIKQMDDAARQRTADAVEHEVEAESAATSADAEILADRKEIYRAVDQLLEARAQVIALQRRERELANHVTQAEQDVWALRAEPAFPNDGGINPNYIERFGQLYQLMQEHRQCSEQSRLPERQEEIAAREEAIRRLLEL